jgi:hypothetical protein
MRVLATDIDIDGQETAVRYVPDGDTTIWERILDAGQVVSDTDTGQPAPPVETFADPLEDIAAELPAATLEEVNALLAQVLSTLGGN